MEGGGIIRVMKLGGVKGVEIGRVFAFEKEWFV